MKPLTSEQRAILKELWRLAGPNGVVTGRQLREAGFADWLAHLLNKTNLGYFGSLQSRLLQALRDNEHIRMERRNGGTYTLISKLE